MPEHPSLSLSASLSPPSRRFFDAGALCAVAAPSPSPTSTPHQAMDDLTRRFKKMPEHPSLSPCPSLSPRRFDARALRAVAVAAPSPTSTLHQAVDDLTRRFKKMPEYHEKSWQFDLYKGRKITPEPMNQGKSPTCIFYSVTKAAQMDIHRQYADINRPCDIVTDPEAMVIDFVGLNEMGIRDMGNFNKEWLSRIGTATWIGKRLGISATSSGWEGTRRLQLEEIVCLGDSVHHDDLAELLDAGKPVLAILTVEPHFAHLGKDELYCCTPEYTIEGDLRPPFGFHMVVLVGHGEKGEPITFLNSSGNLFGNGGFGHTNLEDFVGFFKIEMSCPPTIIGQNRPYSTPSKQCDRPYMDAQRWRPEEAPLSYRSHGKQPAHHSQADASPSWHPRVTGPSLVSQHANGEREIAESIAKTMEKPKKARLSYRSKGKQPAHHSQADASPSCHPRVTGPSLVRQHPNGEREIAESIAKTMEKTELKQEGDEAFGKQDYTNASFYLQARRADPSECKSRDEGLEEAQYRKGEAKGKWQSSLGVALPGHGMLR